MALFRVRARVRERVWVRVWVRISLGSGSGSGSGSQAGVPVTVEARNLRVRPSRGQGLTLYAAQLSAVLPSHATRLGCAFTSSKEQTMASWPAQLASTSGVSPWCVRQSTARLCAEPESREKPRRIAATCDARPSLAATMSGFGPSSPSSAEPRRGVTGATSRSAPTPVRFSHPGATRPGAARGGVGRRVRGAALPGSNGPGLCTSSYGSIRSDGTGDGPGRRLILAASTEGIALGDTPKFDNARQQHA